jgi:protein-disulfide isomerase
MTKRLWIFAGIIVVLFIGFASMKGSDTPTAADNGARTTHKLGEQRAKVELVEYGDFQCAACLAYYPIVEQIIQKYQGRISFEYRHYPLTTIHRNAFAAARASEAASKQGKFWEMYRALFEGQSDWADSNNATAVFDEYARRLGLDVPTFRTDFMSGETNGIINASIAEFNNRGLAMSTPTFLLNGKKITPRNLEEFNTLIDKQLQRSDKI